VITRRAVLGGAAALLVRPASALGADAVAATLLELYVAEQHAALAYRKAGGELARIGEQEDDHARVLAAQLGGLARPQPAASTDPAVLRGAAAEVAAGGDGVGAAIALERELLDAYRKAIPVFKEPEMRRSAATIMASHGQHLSVLYERSGRDPIDSSR
jgi:hypothetical protein